MKDLLLRLKWLTKVIVCSHCADMICTKVATELLQPLVIKQDRFLKNPKFLKLTLRQTCYYKSAHSDLWKTIFVSLNLLFKFLPFIVFTDFKNDHKSP